MSSAQQVTVSFDYDAYARASEEMGFTSDEVMIRRDGDAVA